MTLFLIFHWGLNLALNPALQTGCLVHAAWLSFRGPWGWLGTGWTFAICPLTPVSSVFSKHPSRHGMFWGLGGSQWGCPLPLLLAKGKWRWMARVTNQNQKAKRFCGQLCDGLSQGSNHTCLQPQITAPPQNCHEICFNVSISPCPLVEFTGNSVQLKDSFAPWWRSV